MTIWWTTDPRLLPGDMLKAEHAHVHDLLSKASDRPQVERLLAVRHELVAYAIADRTGKPHSTPIDYELPSGGASVRTVQRYRRDCQKYWQIDAEHMQREFNSRILKGLRVPQVKTPWAARDMSLGDFRRAQGLDSFYAGVDPLSKPQKPDKKARKRR